MKKLFSILTVTFLICALCVPAFAISDSPAIDKTEVESAYGDNYGEDYALFPGVAFKSNGEEIDENDALPSGTSIFYPIIVRNQRNGDADEWYYATSVSDIRDINVRLSKIAGSKLIDDADIVSKRLDELKDDDGHEVGKVRCVEVELDAYYGNKTEQDLAFDLQLRERNSVVFDSGDYNGEVPTDFFIGQDAEEPVEDKDKDSSTGYGGKMRGDCLKFYINDDTRVVRLDEFEGDEVEEILISGGDIDFTYEVDASDQDPLYLQVNDKADIDITDKYYENDLYFVNFPGEPTFDHLGTFSYAVPDPDEKYYIYEINGRHLEEVDARYDRDTDCLVFKTRTLGSYVISEDKKLDTKPVTSTDNDDDDSENITVGSNNNPNTGGSNNNNGGVNVGASKPNFDSSDNNILNMMVATAVVSTIGVCSIAVAKKQY